MRHFNRHLISALLLAAAPAWSAPITQGAPGAVPPEQFRIMTDAEIAEHKRIMQSLSGTAREDYRNAQYQQLKQRAQAQGYLLPDTPPWGHTEVVPANAAASAEPAQAETVDMAALVEQQRQVVAEALAEPTAEATAEATAEVAAEPADEAPAAPVTDATTDAAAAGGEPAGEDLQLDSISQAQPEAAPGESVAETSEDSAYQQQMQQRYDDFMAQREARRAQLDAQRRAQQEAFEARRQRYQQELAQRRQLQQQQAQPPYGQAAPAQPQWQVAPMPYAPYGYGYAPGYPQAYPQPYPQPYPAYR